MKKKTNNESLKKKINLKKINYPKPDNKVTFDRLTNLSFSGTNHKENQPCHLILENKEFPMEKNLKVV